MNDVNLSIIFLNYNSFADVLKQLRILDKREYNFLKIRVILVDNNSDDNSFKEECLLTLKNQDTYIQNTANLGYAKGNNIGIRKSIEFGDDFSFVLNPDIILPSEEVIFNLVEEALNYSDFVIGGPRIEGIKPYFKRPSLLEYAFPFIYYLNNQPPENSALNHIYRAHGSALLINNFRFEKIELFDENTFLYFEEEIVAEKLFNTDCRTYLLNQVLGHETSKSVNARWGFRKYFLMYESLLYFLENYRGCGILKAKVIAFFCIFQRVIIRKILK